MEIKQLSVTTVILVEVESLNYVRFVSMHDGSHKVSWRRNFMPEKAEGRKIYNDIELEEMYHKLTLTNIQLEE